jgi:hypothetical protein
VKAIILAISLSTSLAIGTTACAHQQLTNRQLAKKAVPVVLVVGLVIASLAAEKPVQ